MKKFIFPSFITFLSICLSSCALVTTPVKVAGKAATTTIGVAGKVANGGIGLLTSDEDKSNDSDND